MNMDGLSPKEFRAWHKRSQQMLYSDNQRDYFSWKEEGQDIVIMQYIGLKDHNGTKIFEGDIIHWNYLIMYSKKMGEIWEDTYAQVIWVHTGFTVKKIKGKLRSLNMETADVIGNIYENPELLEAKE